MTPASKAEIVLLQIIYEVREASGYEINAMIEKRQYRLWAGIGTTSIYVGLDKLSKKGYVKSFLDTNKKGKGPVPRKFKLTKKGLSFIQETVYKILSNTESVDPAFYLGLSGIHILPQNQVVRGLEERLKTLEKQSKRVKGKYTARRERPPQIPLFIKALYEYSIFMTKHEKEFVQLLIETLNNETP